MTEDAKRAAKVEKKLKVLLGGYQVRTYSVSVWFYLIRFKPYFAWRLVTKAKIIITFISAQKILELKQKKNRKLVTSLTELIKLKSERGQKMNFNQFK